MGNIVDGKRRIFPRVGIMESTSVTCHPEDFSFVEQATRKQALALQFVAIYRRFPLEKLLEAAGISLAEYGEFYEGRLSPTRAEWMRLHRLLKIPPETIMLLADNETPDSEHEI